MKVKDLVSIFGSVHGVRNLWTPALSRSAIYQWGEEVPELRVFQIREKVRDIDEKIAALYPKRKEPRNGHRRAA